MDDNKRLELQSMPPELMALAKDQFGMHYIQFEIWVGRVIDQAFDIGNAAQAALEKQPEERRTGCAQYETCPHGYSTRSACGACGQPTAALSESSKEKS